MFVAHSRPTSETVVVGTMNATAHDLYKLKLISKSALCDAVEAFIGGSPSASFHLGSGYYLDVASAVESSRYATRVTADPNAAMVVKRAAVRAAILLAHASRH